MLHLIISINIENLNYFDEDYNWKPLLKPFLGYADKKNFYLIQVIVLRFQVDHINPNKTQLLEENRANPANARFLAILTKHREMRIISDGKNLYMLKR